MEQVWKKASLFTQSSALFEDLDEFRPPSYLTLMTCQMLHNFLQHLLLETETNRKKCLKVTTCYNSLESQLNTTRKAIFRDFFFFLQRLFLSLSKRFGVGNVQREKRRANHREKKRKEFLAWFFCTLASQIKVWNLAWRISPGFFKCSKKRLTKHSFHLTWCTTD